MRPGWLQPRLFLLMLLAGAADAQVGISGKVIDETGVAVANARIEVRAKAAEKAASAFSDASGNFTLVLPQAPEPAPELSIRASRQGFFVYSGTLRLSPETEH